MNGLNVQTQVQWENVSNLFNIKMLYTKYLQSIYKVFIKYLQSIYKVFTKYLFVW